MDQGNKFPKAVGIATIIVALIIAALLIVTVRYSKFGMAQKFTNEKVRVEKIDIGNSSDTEKLPAGFPADIPVEFNNITDSQTLDYTDKKAKLYSITYVSARQFEELYAEYNRFFATNKYFVRTKTKTADRILFEAMQPEGSLTIIITPQSGKMMVQIAYLARQ
jgi:hypothetical protein